MKTHQQDQETTEVLPDVSVAPEAPAKPSQLPLDFGEWYTDHRPTVYRYVRFRVATRETAEDVTSQVFMKALRSINRYDPTRTAPRTWLLRIARNAVTDHLRSPRRCSEAKAILSMCRPSC